MNYKKKLSVIIISILSLWIFEKAEAQQISILSPSGGETWLAGSNHSINWSDNGINYVSGWYSTNGGANWTQIEGFSFVPNNHSFSWTIPNIPSTNCKVKISNADNQSIFGVSSGKFTIGSAKKTIILISPNGGEKWIAGSQQNITWSDDGISSISGWYSINSGNNWIPITGFSGYMNNHQFLWNVPASFSNSCKVKISDANDNTLFDISNSNFTIDNSSDISDENNLFNSIENKFITNNKVILQIKSKIPDNYKFELFDLLGYKIESSLYSINFEFEKIIVDLNILPKGIYYFNLQNKIYLLYKYDN